MPIECSRRILSSDSTVGLDCRKLWLEIVIRKTLFLSAFALLLSGCQPATTPPLPAVVEGDSMGPHLPGNHHLVSCVECGNGFPIENLPVGDQAICPNCGFSQVAISADTAVPASGVLIHPLNRAPKRWDVVGLKLEDDHEFAVKRIVGLPGEVIEIRGGDLFNQRGVIRKSWDIQKQMRIPIFDTGKSVPDSPFQISQRFRFKPDGGWGCSDQPVFIQESSKGIQWLDYLHWRNCKRQGKREDEFPISDHYGFNQRTTRSLHSVDDLHVRMEVWFDQDLTFAFRRNQDAGKSVEHIFTLQYNTASGFDTKDSIGIDYRGSVSRKPLQLLKVIPSETDGTIIDFSSFDETLVMKVDGQTVFKMREIADELADPSRPSVFDKSCQQPFRVGCQQGELSFKRFAIWRDIYYLSAPAGVAQVSKTMTAGDGYLLLGDNSPKSLDSRVWAIPTVPVERILGKVGPAETE